jgi:hypothetical protein
MNSTKKYLPYILMLGLAAALVLVGLSSAGDANAEVSSMQAGILSEANEAAAPEVANPAPPASRETTPAMQNPSETSAIVLSGEMGNGGYWNWEDISNLLGVYSAYGAYVQVTDAGQTLDGVPLSYLLHYARINAYAAAFMVTDRADAHYSFPAASLTQCSDCVIALASNNTVTLVLPGFEPAVIHELMRIEANDGTAAVLSMQDLPANPQTIALLGRFQHGGDWTWEQISNLLGVYSSFGAYVRANADDQDFAGVPLSYLLEYAGLDGVANALVIYDRAGDLTSAGASALQESCTNCIIAPAQDNTLVLIMPGHEPEIIAQLAAIEAR